MCVKALWGDLSGKNRIYYPDNSFIRQADVKTEAQKRPCGLLPGPPHPHPPTPRRQAPASGLAPGSASYWVLTGLPPTLVSRSHRQLEQLEVKRSGLAKELVEVREALSGATLQRDMLQAEKAEVAQALTKVRPCLLCGRELASLPGPLAMD